MLFHKCKQGVPRSEIKKKVGREDSLSIVNTSASARQMLWSRSTTGYTALMSRMLDIRERTRLRRVLYAKPTIIFVAFLVALTVQAAWEMYQKSYDALARRDKVTAELISLTEREKELHKDISRLLSEEGTEAEIRSRFMVAKEGEKVMIIASPMAAESHTVMITDRSPSFFQKLMGVVGLGDQ